MVNYFIVKCVFPTTCDKYSIYNLIALNLTIIAPTQAGSVKFFFIMFVNVLIKLKLSVLYENLDNMIINESL